MKPTLLFYSLIFTLTLNANLFAQWNDSIKVYWLDAVEVTSQRLNLGDYQTPVEKDNLSSLLNRNGFNLIRKGVFFAQDVYADGFKKGDINVVVDGERYHCACPNRMDSPLSRVNPLELESLQLSKTATSNQSGLGGKVSFHRAAPVEPVTLKAGFSGSSASSQSFDGSISAEGHNNRISIRYSTGIPYKDADARSFKDLYGYKENFTYKLGELSFNGKANKWKYGATFTYAENVSFPYLRMDERNNKVFSGHISYSNNKVYFNYTRHLMDNGLRQRTMSMENIGKNLTIGAVSDFYDAYFRNWNLDNVMIMPMMMSPTTITNKMIPDLNIYYAALHRELSFGKISVAGRVGISHHNVGEEERIEFYRTLYPKAEGGRWFPVIGLSANYAVMFNNDWGAGALIEAGSEAPETEYLFIALQRPMNAPNWSGNPTLHQPVRGTLRGSINYQYIILDGFATQVWNYANLTNTKVGDKPYTTYENVNAYMLGMNLRFEWEFIQLDASYTYAQNTTNDSPLSEIQPLSIATKLTSPVFYSSVVYLKHTYNDAQTRVDESLNESTTPAWNRIDIGVMYNAGNILISIDLENLTNTLYYQHLSYLRDPFASGFKIFEPGTSIRLNVRLNSVFD
jgi:iron complex outermembrane receptor protein